MEQKKSFLLGRVVFVCLFFESMCELFQHLAGFGLLCMYSLTCSI